MKNYKEDSIYYSEVFDIPIDQIIPSPYRVRKYYDNLKMNDLVKNIKEYGIIQPLSVRETEDGYELISGERRYKAALSAGLRYVPAILIECDDEKSAIMLLLENLHREDLSFFEIAEGYKNLIRSKGYTQEELAKRVGMSRSSVANKIRLLRLPQRLRKLVHDYKLTESHALALLSLPDEETQLQVINKIHKDKLSIQESHRLIENILLKHPEKLVEINGKNNCDISLFSSTVNRAVEIMKYNGVDAKMVSENYSWGYKFIIELRKE